MKTAVPQFLIVILIVCLGWVQNGPAVSPPPDGGYPGGNTAEGQNALQSTTSGGFNTAVGYFSLFGNITGSYNTAVGAGALDLNVNSSNTATGAAALLFNNTGSSNTANGAFALFNNTTGTGNVAMGYQAGSALTTGNNNIYIGNLGVAAESNTIRIGDPTIHAAIFMAGITALNPAVPNQAVLVDPATGQLGSADISSFGVVTTDPENTGVGDQALVSNTGGYNTATGFEALSNNTTADSNTATGAEALLHNGNGTQNCAFGDSALASNGFNVSGADYNDAYGAFALFNNIDGYTNNAFGNQALFENIHGAANTAFGDLALQNNDMSGNGMGAINTAVGANALSANVDGNSNNAVGYSALGNNTDGAENNAMGVFALQNSTGFANTALGDSAGQNLTAGSGNVYIGAGVLGQSAENNHTYILNINSTTVSGGGSDTVTVDLTTGLLGHLSSSRRYKEDIKQMNNASEALYRLAPMTYRYKKEIDRSQSPAFGLIAEEVADVNPALVAFNAQGQPESVHYEMVNAMLLNEFLKEHKTVQEQGATIARLEQQIKALTAGLQKVSARLELSKPAPQTALNRE